MVDLWTDAREGATVEDRNTRSGEATKENHFCLKTESSCNWDARNFHAICFCLKTESKREMLKNIIIGIWKKPK